MILENIVILDQEKEKRTSPKRKESKSNLKNIKINQSGAIKSNKNKPEQMKRIDYKVPDFSSEEEAYPISELLNTNSKRGWQSVKYSNYPQELVLEFENKIKLKQIQFLFHQYKISSKIEILICENTKNFNNKDDSNQEEIFKKIGFFFPDSNQKSDFQARELKSIFLEYECKKLKFIMHRNHNNMNNIFKQIGIIKLNIFGENIINKIPQSNNDFHVNLNQIKISSDDKKATELLSDLRASKEKTRADGLSNNFSHNNYNLSKINSENLSNNLSEVIFNNNLKRVNTFNDDRLKIQKLQSEIHIFDDKIKYLTALKEKAIIEENYDKAKLLSDYIKKLKELSEKISILEEEKKIAVDKEDFDRAKLLKNNINKLKYLADIKDENTFNESNNRDKNELNYIDDKQKIMPDSFKNIDRIKNIENFGKKKRFQDQSPKNKQSNHEYNKHNDAYISKEKENENESKINNFLRKNYINQLNDLLDSTRRNYLSNIYHSVEIKSKNINKNDNDKFKIYPQNQIKIEKKNKKIINHITKSKIQQEIKKEKDKLNEYNNTPKKDVFKGSGYEFQMSEIFGAKKGNLNDLIRSNEIIRKNKMNTDRDDREIKGINIDFSEFVMEKLKLEKKILKQTSQNVNNDKNLHNDPVDLLDYKRNKENGRKSKIINRNKINFDKNDNENINKIINIDNSSEKDKKNPESNDLPLELNKVKNKNQEKPEKNISNILKEAEKLIITKEIVEKGNSMSKKLNDINIKTNHNSQITQENFLNNYSDPNIIITENDDISKTDENSNNLELIFSDAKPLYDFLSYNIIKMLFSKNWKIREKALKLLDEEINNYPYLKSNKIFGTNSSNNILFAVFYSASNILSSNFLPLVIKALNLIKNTLAKLKTEDYLSDLIKKKKSELNSITIKCLELIIEKLGESNTKIKEFIDITLLEFSLCPLIGEKFTLEILINGLSKNLFGKTNKFIFGKLSIINKIINSFGIFSYSKTSLLENIIEFAIKAFDNTNKEIRLGSVEILCSIYRFIEKKEELILQLKSIDAKLFGYFIKKVSLNPSDIIGNKYIDNDSNFNSNSNFNKSSPIKRETSQNKSKNYICNNDFSRSKISERGNKSYLSNSKNKGNATSQISSSINIHNKNDKMQKTPNESSIIKRPPSNKKEFGDISDIEYNESIKIIINNNNFNYNYKNKNSNKLNADSINEISSFKENENKKEINKKIPMESDKVKNNEKNSKNFLDNYNTIDSTNKIKPLYINFNKDNKNSNNKEISDLRNQKSSISNEIEEIFENEEGNEEDKINYNVEKQICNYCGFYDLDLKSKIYEHIHEFCPWFIKCKLCKRIVEISDLNNHFISTCKKKDNFLMCYKCKEAILKKNFEKHLAENSCISVKSSNYYNRCPLCHSDHTPSGPLGWQMHLLEDGCPCNPRNII